MSRTSVTSRDLAAFLSDQLAPELDGSGYRISAEDADVVLLAPQGDRSSNGAAGILDDVDDQRDLAERVTTAARAVLSHVQDTLAAATGQPWPGTGPQLPLPDARIEEGDLIAWFGDSGSPVWSSSRLPVTR